MSKPIADATLRRFIAATGVSPKAFGAAPSRRELRWAPALAQLAHRPVRPLTQAGGGWLDSSLDLRTGLATVELFDA